VVVVTLNDDSGQELMRKPQVRGERDYHVLWWRERGDIVVVV